MARILTETERLTYERDGVVLIPGAVPHDWLSRASTIVDRIAKRPGRWATDTGDRGDGAGRALDERYLWRHDEDVRRFVFESGIAGLVGEALGTPVLRFYYDHWFVKEPGPRNRTPWHQDAPYWPFSGRQIASLWLPFDDVDARASGLELIKGSHRWGRRFKATRFVESDATDSWIDDATGVDLPDIDSERDRYDIFSEGLEAGDALIFSAWIVHASTDNVSPRRRAALSTRWLGSDVRWRPHEGADPTVRPEDVQLSPGELIADDDRFPIVWQKD